ncbi:hypothetical protein N9917_03565 [Deltaproteobacteria bacterium]|nr:hypothetical protein [Deltaproteobacteria bacterium]
MKVEFASPIVEVATQDTSCVECAGAFRFALGPDGRTIKAGDTYIRWDCTINGEHQSFALHLSHGPFRPPVEEYGTHATIARYTMTDDMDFHGGECDECGHDMGGNGATPHVITSDSDTLCFPCAILAGITEYTLDPETCLLTLEGHPNREHLKESDVDTLDKMVKDGVWDAVQFTGGKIGEGLPEYQAAQEKWHNFGRKGITEQLTASGDLEELAKFEWHPLPEDAPVWDETVDGPYWRFSDTYRRPFSRAAYRAAWAFLFPQQPDPEGPCPLTQRT